MTPGQRAEARVAQLGITDPLDLDIEAIAMDAGMSVVYEKLVGCEATLVGVRDRAIATIKPSIRGRERFSIGHELGHWDMHRGRSFSCRLDDPDQNLVSNRDQEKEADEYSAHLLMPGPLFTPAVKLLGMPGFKEIERLSEQFATSSLATVMRLADINTLPVVLACYSADGKRRWFKFAGDVTRRWRLRDWLDEDSFAYDLIKQGKGHPSLGKQSADAWFSNDDADRYEVSECCIPGRNGEVLVLLYLESSMLFAKYDPSIGNRKFATGALSPSPRQR